MDYTAPPPKKVKQVTQYDLNECFVQYILVSVKDVNKTDIRTTFSVKSTIAT